MCVGECVFSLDSPTEKLLAQSVCSDAEDTGAVKTKFITAIHGQDTHDTRRAMNVFDYGA